MKGLAWCWLSSRSQSHSSSIWIDHYSGGSRIFPKVRQLPKVLLFFKFFAENCMKMKEFGPLEVGARVPGAPLDPPMHYVDVFQVAVEGNIGSGKSTFLQYFRESENVEIASEPVEMWKNVRGHNTLVSPNIKLNIFLITARKRSLQMLCFYTCLSVILFRRGEYLGRYPLGRYTPWAGTSPGQVYPPSRYTPGRYTPHAVHAGIRSTSGRYASHRNAFLFKLYRLLFRVAVYW